MQNLLSDIAKNQVGSDSWQWLKYGDVWRCLLQIRETDPGCRWFWTEIPLPIWRFNADDSDVVILELLLLKVNDWQFCGKNVLWQFLWKFWVKILFTDWWRFPHFFIQSTFLQASEIEETNMSTNGRLDSSLNSCSFLTQSLIWGLFQTIAKHLVKKISDPFS